MHSMFLFALYAGVDFVGNIHLPHIDFATVHVYPGESNTSSVLCQL